MLTVSNYQPINYNKPNFKGKNEAIKNVYQLSESSQILLRGINNLIQDSKTGDVYRSRRFIDGSFVEVENKKTALLMRLLKRNKRPQEIEIENDGNIEYKNKLETNINTIFEKYFPDILEKRLFKLS